MKQKTQGITQEWIHNTSKAKVAGYSMAWELLQFAACLPVLASLVNTKPIINRALMFGFLEVKGQGYWCIWPKKMKMGTPGQKLGSWTMSVLGKDSHLWFHFSSFQLLHFQHLLPIHVGPLFAPQTNLYLGGAKERNHHNKVCPSQC